MTKNTQQQPVKVPSRKDIADLNQARKRKEGETAKQALEEAQYDAVMLLAECVRGARPDPGQVKAAQLILEYTTGKNPKRLEAPDKEDTRAMQVAKALQNGRNYSP